MLGILILSFVDIPTSHTHSPSPTRILIHQRFYRRQLRRKVVNHQQ
jgi:hypothetical protein